jgi:NAD(P)-dependent dehydrogenase (short-subunit alcohol dehydrogenase family)
MAVIVITGCSSGFGLETALAFARNGDTVVATMRDVGRGQQLIERARTYSGSLEVLALDVTDDISVTTQIRDVLQRHEQIDVLVNNAGVAYVGAVETMDLLLARQVLETNYWGAVRMIQAVLPAMRERRAGVIVNVSSIAGRISPLPFSNWYAVSKHGVCLMSEALHMELLQTGVRVVSIEPGFFRTALTSNGSQAESSGEYGAEEAWVSRFYEQGVLHGDDPAQVATVILDAVADPSTSLHVTVPKELELGLPARLSIPFEETVVSKIANLEATAGPRPVRPSLKADASRGSA